MSIPPVNLYDDGVENSAQLGAVDSETPDAVKSEQPAKPDLPPPTNRHSASYDTRNFSANTPEDIRAHLAVNKKRDELNRKTIDADKIVFSQYVDAQDEAQVRETARNFAYLLARGYQQEAALQFRQMSTDLQENIGYVLLTDEDFDETRPVLDGLFKGAQISQELKNLVKEKLVPPKSNALSGLLGSLKTKMAQAYQVIDNVKILQDKPAFLSLEKLIYTTQNAGLISQYEVVRQFVLDAPQNIQNEFEKLKRGEISAAELAGFLDGTVTGANSAYMVFSELLAEYQAANPDADFSELQTGVQSTMDNNNQIVSQTVRDVYAQSGGKIVLRLSESAIVLINESLQRLGAAPLESLFVDTEDISPDLKSAVQNCYEYTSQYEPQIRDAFDLVLSIFRAQSSDVQQWKEKQLEELRKLEEFFEKVAAALREFNKKLEDNKVLKNLEAIQIVINSCLRGIGELEERLSSKLPMNKSVASVLAKYRIQYESERWQKVKELICN